MSELEAQLEPKKYIGLSLNEEYVSHLEQRIAELEADEIERLNAAIKLKNAEFLEELKKANAKFEAEQMTELQKRAFVSASGSYLTEYLPDNWWDMEKEYADEFVELHAWSTFEYWSANEILEQIQNLADEMLRFLKEEQKWRG
jgi:uncharacterized small protein (DUF1192 family)